MAYYTADPKSPFYPYMLDTSVEESLSLEELDSLYRTKLAGILFSMYEGFEYSEDEKNYMIYASLNKIPAEVAYNNMQRAEGLEEIDFEEVNRRRKEYDELVAKGIL